VSKSNKFLEGVPQSEKLNAIGIRPVKQLDLRVGLVGG
jgi:hypothetical protein